ncbi:hypothetical protein FISHEDRAFT_78701 [Fistulina hepatica ATCC 64428]|uniref:Uncharacterized protein n=1 Tax=Fistulina hepatica ATCC 64428 TaxID=1128425 RepID=A0A0D6ZZD0_9AGAR|nr:hypothetical protein FISHEDRAFT_78701 [Fistulina hepatica ATCC 64428]
MNTLLRPVDSGLRRRKLDLDLQQDTVVLSPDLPSTTFGARSTPRSALAERIFNDPESWEDDYNHYLDDYDDTAQLGTDAHSPPLPDAPTSAASDVRVAVRSRKRGGLVGAPAGLQVLPSPTNDLHRTGAPKCTIPPMPALHIPDESMSPKPLSASSDSATWSILEFYGVAQTPRIVMHLKSPTGADASERLPSPVAASPVSPLAQMLSPMAKTVFQNEAVKDPLKPSPAIQTQTPSKTITSPLAQVFSPIARAFKQTPGSPLSHMFSPIAHSFGNLAQTLKVPPKVPSDDPPPYASDPLPPKRPPVPPPLDLPPSPAREPIVITRSRALSAFSYQLFGCSLFFTDCVPRADAPDTEAPKPTEPPRTLLRRRPSDLSRTRDVPHRDPPDIRTPVVVRAELHRRNDSQESKMSHREHSRDDGPDSLRTRTREATRRHKSPDRERGGSPPPHVVDSYYRDPCYQEHYAPCDRTHKRAESSDVAYPRTAHNHRREESLPKSPHRLDESYGHRYGDSRSQTDSRHRGDSRTRRRDDSHSGPRDEDFRHRLNEARSRRNRDDSLIHHLRDESRTRAVADDTYYRHRHNEQRHARNLSAPTRPVLPPLQVPPNQPLVRPRDKPLPPVDNQSPTPPHRRPTPNPNLVRKKGESSLMASIRNMTGIGTMIDNLALHGPPPSSSASAAGSTYNSAATTGALRAYTHQRVEPGPQRSLSSTARMQRILRPPGSAVVGPRQRHSERPRQAGDSAREARVFVWPRIRRHDPPPEVSGGKKEDKATNVGSDSRGSPHPPMSTDGRPADSTDTTPASSRARLGMYKLASERIRPSPATISEWLR